MITILGINISQTQLINAVGALVLVLIGSILFRKNRFIVRKREERDKIINETLSPFNEAIANIHNGEHNHIFIMNSFFRSQEEAIMIFMANISKRKRDLICRAWNTYKEYYESNAKDHIYEQFASFPESLKKEDLNLLHEYLSDIVKIIKKL